MIAWERMEITIFVNRLGLLDYEICNAIRGFWRLKERNSKTVGMPKTQSHISQFNLIRYRNNYRYTCPFVAVMALREH